MNARTDQGLTPEPAGRRGENAFQTYGPLEPLRGRGAWLAWRGARGAGVGREVVVLEGVARGTPGAAELLEALRDQAAVGERDPHPHLVPVLGWEEGDPERGPCLVRAYVDGPHLDGLLRRVGARQQAEDLPGLLRLVEQGARAVAHLHRQGRVHGEILATNLRIDREGAARLVGRGYRLGSTLAGRRGVPASSLAPEVVAGEVHGQEADVYQLGVVLSRLLERRPAGGWAAPTPWLARVHGLVGDCLDPDRAARPSAEALARRLAELVVVRRPSLDEDALSRWALAVRALPDVEGPPPTPAPAPTRTETGAPARRRERAAEAVVARSPEDRFGMLAAGLGFLLALGLGLVLVQLLGG